MLSEALCSRARRVAEKKGSCSRDPASVLKSTSSSKIPAEIHSTSSRTSAHLNSVPEELDGKAATASDSEVPFARRAREVGRAFRGGKLDGEFHCRVFLSSCAGCLYMIFVDISVVVAVISPTLDVECSRHI